MYGYTAPNEFSTKGLRAYGRRFGGNGASKHTKSHLFHCRISTLLYRLVIKILRGGSSLASLSIASNNDVVAILYKILDMGSRSRCGQNPSKIRQNRKITRISKLWYTKRHESWLSKHLSTTNEQKSCRNATANRELRGDLSKSILF